MLESLKALLLSKRFWAAIAGVILVVLENFGVPINHDQVQMLVMLIASWIVGDSIRSTLITSQTYAADAARAAAAAAAYSAQAAKDAAKNG